MMLNTLVVCCGMSLVVGSSVDVTYGSAVKLGLDNGSKNFLRSFDVQWHGRSRPGNIVTTVNDETNPEVYWVISPSRNSTNLSGDIVKCGSRIRLVHGVTGKELAADMNQPSNVAKLNEVTAVSEGDEFEVECSSGSGIWGNSKEKWEKGEKIQLKHASSGGYLKSSAGWVYNQNNCPRCPMVGDQEVVVTKSGSGGGGTFWIVEGGVLVGNPQEADDKGRDEL